jgi:hypothetical protein
MEKTEQVRNANEFVEQFFTKDEPKRYVTHFTMDGSGNILHTETQSMSDYLYDIKFPKQRNGDFLTRSRKCLDCGQIVKPFEYFTCLCRTRYHSLCECGCEEYLSTNTIDAHEKKVGLKKSKKKKIENGE